MKERPQSVTVICWILIVLNALAVLPSTFSIFMVGRKPEIRHIMEQSPIPIPVQFVIAFVGIAIVLSSAIAMLNGCNWGRWLYVIWNIIGTVIGLVTSPFRLMMIPGVLIFVIITIFLFRTAANQYFGATEGGHGPEGV